MKNLIVKDILNSPLKRCNISNILYPMLLMLRFIQVNAKIEHSENNNNITFKQLDSKNSNKKNNIKSSINYNRYYFPRNSYDFEYENEYIDYIICNKYTLNKFINKGNKINNNFDKLNITVIYNLIDIIYNCLNNIMNEDIELFDLEFASLENTKNIVLSQDKISLIAFVYYIEKYFQNMINTDFLKNNNVIKINYNQISLENLKDLFNNRLIKKQLMYEYTYINIEECKLKLDNISAKEDLIIHYIVLLSSSIIKLNNLTGINNINILNQLNNKTDISKIFSFNLNEKTNLKIQKFNNSAVDYNYLF